ncbi:MAG TPA: hypothetical protein VF186_06245 [Gaiellaceae bacterium]|jgi:hypothetical protein
MKLVSTVAAAVAALALCVSAATAAPAHRGSTQARTFCGAAHAISKYLKGALAMTNGVVDETPANLELAYTTVVNSEPALTATAPKSLRPSLAQVFSFLNLVKADFEKADWQVAKMKPYFPALIAKGNAIAKPARVVRAYLHGTCHIGI